jgi:hypothetical protein
MQVYGLFYNDIDSVLVCLWQNKPSAESVRIAMEARTGWVYSDETIANVLARCDGDYDLIPLDVIQNGEV